MKVENVVSQKTASMDNLTSEVVPSLRGLQPHVDGCGKPLMTLMDVDSDGNPLKGQHYIVFQETVYCRPCYETHIVPCCVECSRKILGSLAPPGVGDHYAYYINDGQTYCHDHLIPSNIAEPV